MTMKTSKTPKSSTITFEDFIQYFKNKNREGIIVKPVYPVVLDSIENVRRIKEEIKSGKI